MSSTSKMMSHLFKIIANLHLLIDAIDRYFESEEFSATGRRSTDHNLEEIKVDLLLIWNRYSARIPIHTKNRHLINRLNRCFSMNELIDIRSQMAEILCPAVGEKEVFDALRRRESLERLKIDLGQT